MYLRSRRVPATCAVILVSTAAVWAFGRWGADPPVTARLVVVGLALGISAAAVGLGGADAALDRTAALRWPAWRAGHVVALAAAVGGALVAAQAIGEPLVPNLVIVRNCAGFAGLAAFGAAFFGAARAWWFPMGWALPTALPLPQDTAVMQALTWPMAETGTAAATFTATALAVLGTLTYAIRGYRA
ncbi:hypothetical protein AB0I53_12320 [Saccharopolyspora sp. NPDC050389]|uniref:hypothetical protein n=1 Tax=Saccharopolyspora sp. NPDC050389 TaxID=3155516 RepID=UPI00340056E7